MIFITKNKWLQSTKYLNITVFATAARVNVGGRVLSSTVLLSCVFCRCVFCCIVVYCGVLGVQVPFISKDLLNINGWRSSEPLKPALSYINDDLVDKRPMFITDLVLLIFKWKYYFQK